MIDFTINYSVAPKQGDRSRIVRTKTGKQFVSHYTPANVRRNASTLALLMQPYVPDKPLEGPLRLSLDFGYLWRTGTSLKVRTSGTKPKDTRPDWDNLCKNVCDVLQESGFFANDSQLAEVHVTKTWVGKSFLRVRLSPI